MINIFLRNKPADNHEHFHTANKSLHWDYTCINNTLYRLKRLWRTFELFTTRGIGLIIYIILFPVLEQLSKTIVLNLGRFQEKQETTIYGLSLGLGFGSVFTPAAIIMGNFQEINVAFIAAIIGSFGIILFHAATGAIIGYGVYSHKLTTYLTFAILLQIPITTLIGVTNLFTISYLQISIVVYGIIVYWYATKKIMPRILQESQRRKRTQKEIDIKSK